MEYKVANAYYFRSINSIGGIESHLYYVAKKYSKYDIAVFYKNGDATQIKRLSKYVRCVKLRDSDFVRCDKLFCCFNREILNQCEAKTKYLVLHGDYKDMLERGQLNKSNLPIDSRIDEYLGVSQLVCDSWKEVSGIEATNIYQPIALEEVNKPLLFMSATRLTREKGWERMKILAQRLNDAKINYTWLIYTDSPKEQIDNLVFVKPRLDISSKMAMCDAFIQLSDNEGYCLSVVEALMNKVPVIATKLPVFDELGLNDTNSILLDLDMKEIPLEKIKEIDKLKFSYKQPKDKWDKYLSHKPNDYKLKTYKVKATDEWQSRKIVDSERGIVPEANSIWEVTEERLTNLLDYESRVQRKFIEVLDEKQGKI